MASETGRGLLRTFTDYLAMFFMLPIIIVVISGITIFMTSIIKQTHEYMLLEPMMRLTIDVMPYIIMSLVFIAFSYSCPNTQVKGEMYHSTWHFSWCRHAIVTDFYVNCQMFLPVIMRYMGHLQHCPFYAMGTDILVDMFVWSRTKLCQSNLGNLRVCYTN